MRRLTAGLFIVCCIVVSAFAALIVFRLPLTETALRMLLNGQGLAKPELTVVSLSGNRLEIADIRAGTDAAVQVGRIVVEYSLESLARLRAKSLEIVEPHIRLEVDGGAVRISGLQFSLSGNADGEGIGALPVDNLRLRGVRIEAATPYGPFEISASLDLRAPPGKPVDGRLSSIARGVTAKFGAILSVSGADIGNLVGTLEIAEGAVKTAGVEIGALRGGGTFTLHNGKPENAALSLKVSDIHLPVLLEGTRGGLTIDAVYRSGKGSVHAAFAESAGGRGLGVDATISEFVASYRGTSANIALDARMDRIGFRQMETHSLAASLPLTVTRTGREIDIALSDEGRLSAARLDAGNGMRSTGPLVMSLRPTSAPLATIELGGNGIPTVITHTVSAVSSEAGFVLQQVGGTLRTLEIAGARLNYAGHLDQHEGYTGRGTIAVGRATIRNPNVGLQRIEADFTVDGIAPAAGTLQLDIDRLADETEPARFAPIGLTTHVRVENGLATFTANLNDAMRTTRVTASGPWPLSGPRDEIFIEIPTIGFAHGGLQPGALAPALAAFDVSQGRVSGIARVGVDRDGTLRTGAEILVEDLSFDLPGAKVTGLSAFTRFDSLFPPTTPPQQELKIDRVEILTPLDNIRAVYRLAGGADGRPSLDVASLSARLLGGTVSLENVVLTTDNQPVSLPVSVSGLDLPQLFDLIGVEGLKGSGRLSGHLPIFVSGKAIAVRGARLTADGGGILNLKSRTAADFLATQGESVDLALRALEDFHYSELTVDIDRKAGGDARMVLHLLGYNPAVLDGHPFRFNVTLNSNIDELLTALLRGYRTATEGLERAAGNPR